MSKKNPHGTLSPPPSKGASEDFEIVTLGPPRYYTSPTPVAKSSGPLIPSAGPNGKPLQPRTHREPWSAERVARVIARVGYTADEVGRVLNEAMAVADKLDGFLPRTPAVWRPTTRRDVAAAFHALTLVQGVAGGKGPALAAGRELCESLRGKRPRAYAVALVLYGAMLSRAGRSDEAVAAFRAAVAAVGPPA